MKDKKKPYVFPRSRYEMITESRAFVFAYALFWLLFSGWAYFTLQ